MKHLLLLLIGICLTGCNDRKDEVAAGSQPFFTFDRVDYFHYEIDRNGFDSIAAKEDKSRMEQALLQILQKNVPVSTIDTLFIPNMAKLNFNQKQIDPKHYPELKRLFSVNKPGKDATTACEPIFKDVLIFREKRKVVGVAKLSFDCDKSYIIGSRYAPAGFGGAGEFAKLRPILSE
ncbi:MAG: hypothetical protein EOO04_36325 [Chitinophagaceae bacterium]|nr:MAG: hypothetical protein EOO04_36325 [Chitinophagaceae bacterium]